MKLGYDAVLVKDFYDMAEKVDKIFSVKVI